MVTLRPLLHTGKFCLMIARASRFIFASLIVSFVFPVTAGANRPSLRENRVQLDIRDEPDPSDTQSCHRMGQLEISYRNEESGSPRIGVIVTDPRGRRIGYDPVASKTWQELPQADAFVDCDENGEELLNCQATIQICGPVSGAYKLQVVAAANARYSLRVVGTSAEIIDHRGVRVTGSHAEISDISIERRSRDPLIMKYYREPGVKIQLSRDESRIARNQKP